MSTSQEAPAPFLDNDPPPWAARGLATLLLLLFAVAAVAAFAVRIPETVTASFVLAPVRGGDPVRALRSGSIAEVNVAEGQTIGEGQPMFTIVSAAVGDRAAEWQGLASQIASLEERMSTRRERAERERRADEEEAHRLSEQLESLKRAIDIKRQQLATSRDILQREKLSFERGLVGWVEVGRAQVAFDTVALELEQQEAQQTGTRRSLSGLQQASAARRAEASEAERGMLEELQRARIRRTALDQDPVHGGNRLVAASPCAGTVLKLAVRGRGAIVQEGDVLADVHCGHDTLQAELTLPQESSGRIKTGQTARLLYTAFPYQRYGTGSATIRWISPASSPSGLRALADLGTGTVGVKGETQPLLPGMDGRARVVVGRRTLVSYALEPLRQLRENLRAQ